MIIGSGQYSYKELEIKEDYEEVSTNSKLDVDLIQLFLRKLYEMG